MSAMNSSEIRQKFIDFMRERGHVTVPSSSLIPDDPSVLLTTAGMQQFKRYYTGELNAESDFNSSKVASVQKCFRTSDIDEVGDKTHLTFFEMLGNFSFGGNISDLKKNAILSAYEFFTEALSISPERITVTVFAGDDNVPFDEESYRIWHKEIGLPAERIGKQGRSDNFWGPTGSEGPCGPTTELYVDGVEIWNLVFNEYYAHADGHLENLKSPGLDTGMGLERLVVTIQGAESVFGTDLFRPIISKLQELAPGLSEEVYRVLADHLRSSVFLVADGVRPSNKEAGYILRRLLRRVLAYQIKYDIHADILQAGAELVKKEFGEFYPEVTNPEILKILEDEQVKFQVAVAQGLNEIEKYEKISGKDAFYIYETFGLPFELILELAPKSATTELKKKDFDQEFERHQEISRAGAEKKFGGHGLVLNTGELKAGTEEEAKKVIRMHTATHLLHQSLREVLGSEVSQKGSDITAERLRFDFSFGRKMTSEEIAQVEIIVNNKIAEDLPVSYQELSKEEAENTGALHFFSQKYPDVVKVYFVGHNLENSFSKEFCGGPHVNHTLEIGKFKIIKEESVGAGARRIRAIVE